MYHIMAVWFTASCTIILCVLNIIIYIKLLYIEERSCLVTRINDESLLSIIVAIKHNLLSNNAIFS